jgi:hypothetical protein
LSDQNDVQSDMQLGDAAEPAGASEAEGASKPRPGLSSHQTHARHAKRGPKGEFVKVLPPKPPPERRYARQRSRVTNGKALFIDASPHSAQARRFADILAQIVSDLGGVDAE